MKKEKYFAPNVELLECKVEKGFVGSGGSASGGDNGNGTPGVGSSGNEYEFN